jgi:hypothetical protein
VSAFKYPSVIRKNKGISLSLPIIFFLLYATSFLSGCNYVEAPAKFTNDPEYFPLRRGFYQIYDVEEYRYQLGVAETLSYKLKTVVVDSFPNPEGGFTYAIERSRKYVGMDNWLAEDTWAARLTEKEVIVTQGSTPYVILHFPSVPGTQWNGNAYNTEINPNTNTGDDLYSIVSREASCHISGQTFTDCITVLQEDNEEFIIYHDERREIYVRNVGLVSKELTQLHYCNDVDRNCVGQQIIDEGIVFRQLISEYGVE